MSVPRHPNHRPLATLPVELRRTTVPAAAKAWIMRSTGQSVVRAERLPGASSTAVHRLLFPDRHSLVLRRYVWPGFLDDEPIAPQRELDALSFGSGHDLTVPHVVAADITGNDIGDGVPAVLMTFLGGRALASPDPVRLAEAAATVHPGNVLWQRKRCSGIVDWANACSGPAGCDIATCHGNLIGWAGYQVADEFVAAHEALTGEPHHPYWEIASVLEHGPSPWTSRHIAESERRLDRALAALGAT